MKNRARPGTAQTWARTAQPQARTAPFESVFFDFRRKKCHQQVSTRNKPPPIQTLTTFHQMCWWFCLFIKTLAYRDASWVGYTIACSHVHTEHNLPRGHLPKGPRTSFDRTSLSSWSRCRPRDHNHPKYKPRVNYAVCVLRGHFNILFTTE